MGADNNVLRQPSRTERDGQKPLHGPGGFVGAMAGIGFADVKEPATRKRRRWSGTPKVWQIRGHEGLKVIYERFVPHYRLRDDRVVDLLQRLVCKHLSLDELIDASIAPASPVLEAQPTHYIENGEPRGQWGFTVGSNPYFSAMLVDRQARKKPRTIIAGRGSNAARRRRKP